MSMLLSTEDGRVTLAEWVVRWVCAYSDTGAFARFLWERVFQNATSVSAAVAPMPPFGQGFIIEDCSFCGIGSIFTRQKLAMKTK